MKRVVNNKSTNVIGSGELNANNIYVYRGKNMGSISIINKMRYSYVATLLLVKGRTVIPVRDTLDLQEYVNELLRYGEVFEFTHYKDFAKFVYDESLRD